MAQHDYVIANGSGSAVRSDLNNALAAIVSHNSGASEPTTTYAYMPWADTSAGVMKLRNGANNAWITLYQLDGEYTTIPLENGTAAAPSLYFKTSGTDTGLYSPGTDQVAISTAGTGRLFVDSGGDVGINTSPSSIGSSVTTLEIKGGSTARSGGLRVSSSNSSVTGAFYIYDGAGVLGTETATPLDIYTGNSPRARIDSSGRLLVGTSSSSAEARFIVQGGTTASGGAMNIQRSLTTASAGSTIGYINFTNSANNVGASISANGDGTWSAGTSHPTSLTFSTTADGASSPTERLRIASNGALGLAGANYGSSGQALTSNGSGSAPTWQSIPAPAALSTASGSAPSYSARAWVNFDGTGTVAIRASGNVSSITDNGTGDYTVNFTTAMADANYAFSTQAGTGSSSYYLANGPVNAAPTASAFRFGTGGGTAADLDYVAVTIFR